MAQIFHRSANTIAKASILGGVILVVGLLWAGVAVAAFAYFTYAGVARPQPVPFPHQHHVAGLGIDCRYCHTSVEVSGFAGIPPTKTCMNCHSQIWTAAPMLEPVRESYRTGRSLMLDAGQRSAGLRLLRSQHSHQQRRWLQHLPRPRGQDGADVQPGVVADGVVHQLPSRAGEESAAALCQAGPEDPATMGDQIFNMTYEEPSSAHPVTIREGDGYKTFTSQTGPEGWAPTW